MLIYYTYILYFLQVQESIHNTYSFNLQRKYNSNKQKNWTNLQKLLEKKKKNGKTSPLMARASPYR